MTEPFMDVRFDQQYPQQDVADNEVFMSFRNDQDAIAFRRWWSEAGAWQFAVWLEGQPC